MENANNQTMLLNLIDRPAFCVKNNIITEVNLAAQQLQICTDTAISELIKEDLSAYESMKSGCLFLTLEISGISLGASVLKASECDIFTLEMPSDDVRLQAMALAAQQLRIPLSNVMTVAEQLMATIPTDEESDIRKQVGQMNRGLFQLLRIISNMADAQRYTNPDTFRLEPTEFNSLFTEIMEKAKHLLTGSNIHFSYSGLRHPVIGMACPEALERAVYNILSNAVKFSPKGSAVKAKLAADGSMLRFSVLNDGKDITAQLMSKVFARYQRHPGIEDGRHGIGLGMTFVRSVANAHGGTVLIDQPDEGGTRVTMTLAVHMEESDIVRTPIMRLCDYAGGWDHSLLELSETLDSQCYDSQI